MSKTRSYSQSDTADILASKPLWAQGLSDDLIAASVEAANDTVFPPCFMAFLLKLAKGALNALRIMLRNALLALDAQIKIFEYVKLAVNTTVTLLEILLSPLESLLSGFDLTFLFEDTLDILQSCEVGGKLIDLLNKLAVSTEVKQIEELKEKVDSLKRKSAKLSKQITEFIDQKDYLNNILNAIDKIRI